MSKKVILTGTGAVAGAIARALVPAGYDLSTLGGSSKLIVYKNLGNNWVSNMDDVNSILSGNKAIDPFIVLDPYQVPHAQVDLSQGQNLTNYFNGAEIAILTASNASPDQSEQSAKKNHEIDKNSFEAAIKAGVRVIIYTSSVWRTVERSYEDHRDGLIKPDMEAPDKNSPYALAKVQSVRYLRDLAKKNKGILFAHIDLGWYPRETIGVPISNVKDLYLQWWIAECELQQHYLLLTELTKNSHFEKLIKAGENYFSFNGFSGNYPPQNLNHKEFSYDLSNSKSLGVSHNFNVYDVLKQKSSAWRRIPIPSK